MHNSTQFAHVRRGFTVVEILVVVAVIGVMVAIVGPRFRLKESTEVQLAGMQLLQDLELARTRALATRSDVRFVFESGGAIGAYAGYLDHNSDGTFAESDIERQSLRGFGRREFTPRVQYGRGAAPAIPSDASSAAITFEDERVHFNTRGITEPLGSSGVVYLTHEYDKSAVVAVAVSGSGGIRLWSWRNDEWQ
jgi:prepilin-type N-terminal cleavage/methylation domain-containing protein